MYGLRVEQEDWDVSQAAHPAAKVAQQTSRGNDLVQDLRSHGRPENIPRYFTGKDPATEKDKNLNSLKRLRCCCFKAGSDLSEQEFPSWRFFFLVEIHSHELIWAIGKLSKLNLCTLESVFMPSVQIFLFHPLGEYMTGLISSLFR